jgi:hypothetical protein
MDLIGQRFERLLVIKQDGRNRSNQILWLCLCDCGKEIKVTSGDLKSKHTKSCGCFSKEQTILRNKNRTKHQKCKTKIYYIWSSMISRCNDKNHKAYKNYGGRIPPITVCKRWSNKKNGFENFYKDVGDPPYKKSLDRTDNNKGYFPGNWRWATNKQQHRNMKTNININGLCLKDHCKKFNLNYHTIMTRIDTYGYSMEEALTIPIRKYNRRKK